MERFRVLEGLPPYGPMAQAIPPEWGRVGREGVVVEFLPEASPRWTANVEPGLGCVNTVASHPDQRHVLVFSGGDLWSIDPESRKAILIASAIDACWRLADGLVLSRQGLAFLKLGPEGVVWHTRRLSWDGFTDVVVEGDRLAALAWSPVDESWSPCSVNLRTGESSGGAYADNDLEGWQRLANAG